MSVLQCDIALAGNAARGNLKFHYQHRVGTLLQDPSGYIECHLWPHFRPVSTKTEVIHPNYSLKGSIIFSNASAHTTYMLSTKLPRSMTSWKYEPTDTKVSIPFSNWSHSYSILFYKSKSSSTLSIEAKVCKKNSS